MKRQIIKLATVVQNFPAGTVPKGSVKFPFSIDLPQDLPSTFVFAGQKDCELRITYKLRAAMVDCSPKDKAQFKPLIGKRIVVVS